MREQTHDNRDTLQLEWILFSTAFAAGAVDIIGFVDLGGVFASAMTGNFAKRPSARICRVKASPSRRGISMSVATRSTSPA